MITQNNLMRPGTGRGFTAKEAFEAIARAIDAHVEIPHRRDLVGAVRLMEFSTEEAPQFMHELEMHVDTGEGRWLRWVGDALPEGYARAFGEIAQGLLVAQVLDDSEGEDDPKPFKRTSLFRSDVPKSRVPDGADIRALGWRNIPSLATEYKVPRNEILGDMEDVVSDVLRELGMTMSPGMEFIFDDGVVWFRHANCGWVQTTYRDGVAPVTVMPGRDGGMEEIPMPDSKSGPCLYSRRVRATIDDGYALAAKAGEVQAEWVGGKLPYLRNLMLMPASSYLRFMGREFYLLLGRGKEGKSLYCQALSKHLRGQGFLGHVDDLFDSSGMAAENQNVKLATHSYAFFDDVSWENAKKLIPKLKTASARNLPGAPRLQGENALPLEENRSVLVLSSNYDIPSKFVDDALTDRVARVVLKNRMTHYRRIAPMIARYGFWPFMLASALCWCQWQGRHVTGYAWVNPASLTDEQRNIIAQVLEFGYTDPSTAKPFCGWAAMGLVQSTASTAGVKGHVYRPSSKPEKRAIWDSLVEAYEEEQADRAEEEALYEKAVAEAARFAPEPEPDELTALELIERDFGAVETQLGAMGWTGNVFPLRGQGDNAKAPAVALEPMLRTPATHVTDHCEHDEPMRGFAPAPGFMVLDLDIPKGADEGKPDGYGVLRTLGVGIGDPALVVRTGSGGYHLYYRIPDGADIPQIAHKGASAPLPGLPAYEGGVPIDTRVGGRGFVVMPGSSMPDGHKWQVVWEGDIDGDHVLPSGLLDLIQRLAHPKAEPMPRPDHPSAPVDGSYVPHMNTTPVAEGARNDTMSRHVWGWLERSRERGMSDAQRDYGLDQIRERFRASGLPDKEIEDCIRRTGTKLGL